MLNSNKNPIAQALGFRPAVYPGYMVVSLAGTPVAHVRPYRDRTKHFESSKAPKRGAANVKRLTAKREIWRAPLLKNKFFKRYGIPLGSNVTASYVGEPV